MKKQIYFPYFSIKIKNFCFISSCKQIAIYLLLKSVKHLLEKNIIYSLNFICKMFIYIIFTTVYLYFVIFLIYKLIACDYIVIVKNFILFKLV